MQGETISQWLASKDIIVPAEWVNACMCFLEEEHQFQMINMDGLQTLVMNQWLQTDLRDLSTAVLPVQLTRERKHVLTGVYALQVETVLDVSTSAYSQYLKLTEKHNENMFLNTENDNKQFKSESKPNRMLMLQITDGVQTVLGMEYKPIPLLQSDMSPGCKVYLKGPVEVTLGTLLLKADNIQVLGGEVESLVQQNSQIKILARLLGEDVTQCDGNDAHGEKGAAGNDVAMADNHTSNISNVEQVNGSDEFGNNDNDFDYGTLFENFEQDNESRVTSENLDQHQSSTGAVQNSHEVSRTHYTEMDNTMTHGIHSKTLSGGSSKFAIVRPTLMHARTTAKSANSAASSLCFTSYDFSSCLCRTRSSDCFGINCPDCEKMSNIMCSSSDSTNLLLVTSRYPVPPQQDVSRTENSHNVSHPLRQSDSMQEIKPFMLLKDVNSMRSSSRQVVKVKCFISTLTSKLETDDGNKWKLSARIADGTGQLDVIFGSSLLTSLIGFTAKDMTQMKTRIAADPSIKTRVMKALSECQTKLLNLYGIMSLQYDENKQQFKVKSCSPLGRTHMDWLNETAHYFDALNHTVSVIHQEATDLEKSLERLCMPPFALISKVCQLLPHISQRIVNIKGFFVKLTSTLSYKTAKWTLSAVISDGSACLEVDLSDELLTELISFTVAQFVEDHKAHLPQLAVDSTVKLLNIYGILKLSIEESQSRPLVISYRPVTSKDLEELKKRHQRD